MRNYLLTEKERKILESYVYQGTKLDGFAVIMTRVRKQKDMISKDLILIMRAERQLYNDNQRRKGN